MSAPTRSIDEIRWRRWPERRWAARAVRLLIIAVPLVVGLVAGLVWQATVDVGTGTGGRILWLLGFVAVTVIGYALTERIMRRFVPLATLLRMSLAFPDRLPSRYGLALRTGSSARLARRIEEEDFADREHADVAESVLAYALTLSRHDRLTRGHGERVRSYAEVIGREMGLTGDDLDRLRWSGLLHDIGKLMIPADLLNKPGSLTPEEYELVQAHAAAGAAFAEPLRPWLGEWVDAVGQHHERWDGTGYPNGLAGDEISLGARIVAVADVFDVMTSVRSYRPAVSADEAREEIVRCGGTQFDPAVVGAFVRVGLTSPWRIGAPLLGLLSIPGLRQLWSAGQSGGSAVAAGTMVASLATVMGLAIAPDEDEPVEVAAPAPTTSVPPPTTTTTEAPPPPPPPPATTTTTTTTTTTVAPAPQAGVAPPATTTPPPSTTTTTTIPPTTIEEVVVLVDRRVSGEEDVPVVERIEAPDGATFRIIEDSPLGTTTIADDGTLTFVPAPDVSGEAVVVVEVCLGARCDTLDVTIDLVAAPDAPVAADDAITARSGFPVVVDVLDNDRDADGDDLTVRLVDPVPVGVTTDGVSVTVATVIGEDLVAVVTYETVDPTGRSSRATLTLTAEAGPVVALASGPDRSTPAPLDLAPLSGDVYVFVAGADDITRVDFHLDDPDRVAEPLVREQFAPFDLGSSDPSTGLARPFDLTALEPGPHVLTVVVVRTTVPEEIIEVSFTVVEPPVADEVLDAPVVDEVVDPPVDPPTVDEVAVEVADPPVDEPPVDEVVDPPVDDPLVVEPPVVEEPPVVDDSPAGE